MVRMPTWRNKSARRRPLMTTSVTRGCRARRRRIRRARPERRACSGRDAKGASVPSKSRNRSEEHTSELQSLAYLVCRLLLEKKKKKKVPYREADPENQIFAYTEPSHGP